MRSDKPEVDPDWPADMLLRYPEGFDSDLRSDEDLGAATTPVPPVFSPVPEEPVPPPDDPPLARTLSPPTEPPERPPPVMPSVRSDRRGP